MSPSRLLILLTALALAVPATATADWRTAPVIPAVDYAPIDARLAHADVRRNVFAKAGDSISQAASFVQGYGCGAQRLGRHAELSSTIRAFRERRLTAGAEPSVCARPNSFARRSLATRGSQTSAWALNSGTLSAELDQTRPAWLMVMFGTNDARDGRSVAEYRASMAAIVNTALSRGTTPVLYTLPPRLDDPGLEARIEAYNGALAELARIRRLPLVNLWRALHERRVINLGLIADGIHLSVPGVAYDDAANVVDGSSPYVVAHRAARLSRLALRYGANVRNLLTLRTLARLLEAGR